MYYKTLQGETWDIIAKKVYGDEKYADFLMANNFPLLDVFIFSAGQKVFVAKLSDLRKNVNSPPWRR